MFTKAFFFTILTFVALPPCQANRGNPNDIFANGGNSSGGNGGENEETTTIFGIGNPGDIRSINGKFRNIGKCKRPGGGKQTRGNLPFEFRDIDGHNNNIQNPDWGSSGHLLTRRCPAATSTYLFQDGSVMPDNGFNPRQISNDLCVLGDDEDEQVFELHATAMFFQWGQFLDHDIGLSPEEEEEGEEEKKIYIKVLDQNDTLFGGDGIPFTRSDFEIYDGRREQINDLSAYIDASSVYGHSDEQRNIELRDSRHDFRGNLAVSLENGQSFLPLNTFNPPLFNAGSNESTFRVAGDIRANEQTALTAMHTLFVREHNRKAAELRHNFPGMDGDEIYERVRAWVGALKQAITYREFLPVLFGATDCAAMEAAMGAYSGYDSSINAQLHNEFSTAGFRFGHSMISSELLRLDDDLRDETNPLNLQDAFFQPNSLQSEVPIIIDPVDPVQIGSTMENIFRGLATQKSQLLDEKIVPDVRSFLFGEGMGGADLAALNIQRGRDHGLCRYNDARVAYGLNPISTFEELCHPSNLIPCQNLKKAYGGQVDEIELWPGCLTETNYIYDCPSDFNSNRKCEALVGELLFHMLVDQFKRLRDGDRFWYENMDDTTYGSYGSRYTFTNSELDEIEDYTLGRIIKANTDIGNEICDYVFSCDILDFSIC